MKKRILGVLLGSVAVLSLASCNKLENPNNTASTPTQNIHAGGDDTSSTSTPTTVTVDPEPTTTNGGSTTQTVSSTVVPTTTTTETTVSETTNTTTSTSTVSQETKSFTTPEIVGPVDPSTVELTKKNFEDNLKKNGPFTDDAFPSTGTPKMLVVPVNLDDSKKTDKIYNDIKIAFAGTEEETGWESVNSFYKESSYGQLDIQFEFTDWFTPSKNISQLEKYETEDEDGSSWLVKEALKHFDSQYDYNDFDYDGDGFIDNVWIVYNCDVDFENADFWWAWQNVTGFEEEWDGVKSSRFGFAGTDFMYPTKETTSYPFEDIKVDAHTFIHESGHIMGLEDYYDYDEKVGPKNRGLFGADMMDWNIGDHCSLNKILLGWIDPTVVTGKGTVTAELSTFTTTGDVLLIANHNVESIYDEYFLIEFYANVGLNANDLPIMDNDIAEAVGIRVIHVDAHLCYDRNGNVVENGDSSYPGTGFKYDNTGTDKPLIEMLRADYASDMAEYLYTGSLYTVGGATFGTDCWKSFKLNDGSSLFFTLSLKSVENGTATVEINIK